MYVDRRVFIRQFVSRLRVSVNSNVKRDNNSLSPLKAAKDVQRWSLRLIVANRSNERFLPNYMHCDDIKRYVKRYNEM